MSMQVKASRRRVIGALIDLMESGRPMNELAEALAVYLVETGQTRNVELYIRDIELAVAKRFGIATTYVYSARHLKDSTRKKIKDLVKDATSVKAVEMVEKVEPELIGGIIIRTADAELDESVRTKIRDLRSI